MLVRAGIGLNSAMSRKEEALDILRAREQAHMDNVTDLEARLQDARADLVAVRHWMVPTNLTDEIVERTITSDELNVNDAPLEA
jgi:chloramphenicol 3-O-phosphotransferase